ncbi:MAG TPA: phosphoenolpyruvate-utilizing N-terminal domain-containing protein, partial [Thermoanaerobaculia bacterium]|nr:phosphoenolpyruvate-utilizing N-terminal domain-containing protein [Thermoanaerobaculia bacterium]
MARDTEMRVLKGMGVSGGVAIGRAICVESGGPEVFRIHISNDEVEQEVKRLHAGAEHAKGELRRIRSRAGESLGNDLAAIFDAHILLLSDPNFLGRVEEGIRSYQVNAEWAVLRTAEELDKRFAAMDDSYIRERSEDLTDVSRHLVRSLQGIFHHDVLEEA